MKTRQRLLKYRKIWVKKVKIQENTGMISKQNKKQPENAPSSIHNIDAG